jgi:hypothetical protein
MPRSDDSLERLRAAIDELAVADAAHLLTEARIEARARVRATLTDALAHSMLEQLHEQLNEPLPEPLRQTPPAPAPAPAPVPAPAPADRTSDPAWYVYGVVSSDTKLSGELPETVAGQPVALMVDGPLAAVATQVPLEEFDEAALREHLGDMAWVETTARAHEAILDCVCRQATVIPMRMCTVYRTDGGVREMLRREAQPLLEAIAHLRGKAEWGVKLFTDVACAGGGIADVDAGAGDSSGAAYMERKRTERERRERALEVAEAAAARIHESLGEAANDGLLLPLQRREASGHQGDMIFNGVYLVADEEAEAFHEQVRRFQVELEPYGLELVPTGPWPAYNFVPGTIGAAW